MQSEYNGELADAPPMTRRDLQDFLNHEGRSPIDQFIAVAAWGGMRIPHARRTWGARVKLCSVIVELRSKQLSRRDAYALFAGLRPSKLPGMGPAYFTKLIFFLRPDPNGYIMDQWLARSINLLFPEAVPVRLSNTVVSDRNTADDYERFCTRVEHIARELGVTPAEAEERMFSNGGRSKGSWRQYVIARK